MLQLDDRQGELSLILWACQEKSGVKMRPVAVIAAVAFAAAAAAAAAIVARATVFNDRIRNSRMRPSQLFSACNYYCSLIHASGGIQKVS